MKLPLVIQVTLLDLTEWSRLGQWFHVNQLSVLQFVYILHNTRVCTYRTGKRTKASTNMHSKQVLSPIHEICQFLWILKATLFIRVSSSEFWAGHLCRQFHSEIVCTKAFLRYRHLPNLIVCDSRCSPTSVSFLSHFRGNFETAAIEDDAATKTASDGQKVEWPSVLRVEEK